MKHLLFVFALLFSSTLTFAQQDAFERFQFHPELAYDAEITSPADYLGYELGQEFTFHHQVMGYFKSLAEESDKLT